MNASSQATLPRAPSCSGGVEYAAPLGDAEYSTPLAASRTPPPGLAELQVGCLTTVALLPRPAAAHRFTASGMLPLVMRCPVPRRADVSSHPVDSPKQGDYSIRHMSFADDEGRKLAAEPTPLPDGLGSSPGLIAAFLGSASRATVAAAAANTQGGLTAAKTPLLHVNPLAM